MRFIEFAKAKKAPNKLLRPARIDNIATQKVINTIPPAVVRKAKVWEQEGRSKEYITQKMKAWSEKITVKKETIAEKNKLYLANKKIDKTVNDFNKAVQAPSNVVNSPKTNTRPSLNQALLDEGIDVSKLERAPIKDKVINPKSGGSKKLLIGAGVATGAVVLGGLGYGLYRKMRSDKGKKRGSYKNFNFPGELVDFSRKKIKDPNTFFQKIGRKNKKVKAPNKFFKRLGKKYE